MRPEPVSLLANSGAVILLLIGILAARTAPAAAVRRVPPRIESAAPAACTPRATPQGVRLAIVGHYEGAALSTVWLGDPQEEVEVVDLRILPGDPLHLVMTAHSRVIYRFVGDTERVRRLTLLNHYAAGEVGIPASRVEFFRRCLEYGLFYSSEASPAVAAAAVRDHFGRPADFSGGAYSLWRVEIGSAVRPVAAPRVRARLDVENQQLFMFSPGGVTRIDPLKVVSTGPAGPYKVLPQEAGVHQLVASGALVKATKGDAERWTARARARGVQFHTGPHGVSYGAYRVVRPIDIPSGLCGSHSIALYARSPDYIRGDTCHSSLYFDDGTWRDAFQR